MENPGGSWLEIHVLAGRSDDADENRTLGRYRISDLPEAAGGVPEITAIFRLGHSDRPDDPADVARFELVAEDENGPLAVERVDEPSSGAEPLAMIRA